jgi:Ca2+-binding RTX toxin-like protein
VVSGLTLLVALPPNAFGASVAEIRPGNGGGPFVRVNGDAADNEITVTLSGGTYTVSDTTGVTAGPGCTQVGLDASCPAAGITWTVINGGGGGDTLNGSDGSDRINGGPGPDDINGNRGDDVFNSGRGGIDFATCQDLPPFRCADNIGGGAEPATVGFDTVTYADRTGKVEVDLGTTSPRAKVALDDDGTFDGLNGIEGAIGGMASDEIIGGLFGETLSGGPDGPDGPTADVICGGLGNDTVDYSDKTDPVDVSLDGSLATDNDIVAGDTEPPIGRAVSARRDCRPTIKDFTGPRNGQVCSTTNTHPSCPPAPLPRDCVANDGTEGEHDCVGEDVENIVGSPNDDILIGNRPDPIYGLGPRAEPSGANVITGGGGNDLLDGLTGPDVFIGGTGFDAVSYEGRTDNIDASIDGGRDDGSALDRNADSNATDEITGSVEDLIGGSGNDLLKGNGDDNILLGGPGNDRIQGHGGNDQLGGDEGNDALEGGVGGDVMEGGANDDMLFGGADRDAYDGGDGSDIADFSSATTPVSVTLDGGANDGEAFEGDLVHGNVEGAIGGLDDDILHGNDGSGTFIGNGGNDTFFGGLGGDTFIGGEGVDTVSYGDHPGGVTANLAVAGGDGMADENDNITPDVEGIDGSPGDDVLSGDGKDNFINGAAGNDRLSGAEGDDLLGGGLGNDTLNGDVGGDTLYGSEGNDTLNGTAGNDTLHGFTGADVLDGGTGADTMSGGVGIDVVSYASRSADVTADTRGTPDDGVKGENDQIRTDVESVTTGSGDDKIGIRDGAAGVATCGGGSDEVTVDLDDEIGSGCEAGGIRQSSICSSTARKVRMTGSGVVTLRLRCQTNAQGRVQLRSAGRVKSGKGKARRVTLGRKSFKAKKNQILTVRIKVAKGASRVVKRKKRLRVQAVVAVRRDGSKGAMQSKRTTFTLRASGK